MHANRVSSKKIGFARQALTSYSRYVSNYHHFLRWPSVLSLNGRKWISLAIKTSLFFLYLKRSKRSWHHNRCRIEIERKARGLAHSWGGAKHADITWQREQKITGSFFISFLTEKQLITLRTEPHYCSMTILFYFIFSFVFYQSVLFYAFAIL